MRVAQTVLVVVLASRVAGVVVAQPPETGTAVRLPVSDR